MEEALFLFRQAYERHNSIELGIAELKRKGFNQIQTVEVLTEVLTISIVKADELVGDSFAWRS